MTFFRRHWPDLIISLLIVALLVGFGLVLLGGGGRKSAALGGPDSPTPTPSATQQSGNVTPPNNTDTTTQAAPTQPTPAPTEPNPSPTPSAGIPEAPNDVPTIPAQPEPNGQAETQPQAATPSTGNSAQASGTSESPTAGPSASTVGNPVATSRDGTPLRSEYRVSVGTYASESLARERTAAISKLGYTVHLIPVAAGVVAQIGPFSDEQTGRRALADIQRAAPSALLRSPVGQPAPQGTSGSSTVTPTPTPSADQGSAAPTPSPTPAPSDTAQQAAASNTPLYLQVGAFDQQDRAQTLVQQLRDLGYEPSIIAPPGRKVRVLVGPYTGDALTRTEGRLSQSGIEHFRVR